MLAQQPSVNLIRWGILGTSFISETMANAIQQSDHAVLTAIGSRSDVSGNKFSQMYNIDKCYTSYDQLLDDPDIDAIYIGLPNHLHKEWIVKCAAAGKHILCEKPLVLDNAEYQEIYTAVTKNNVICLEALMYRHHPYTSTLLALIHHREIGEVVSINAHYSANIAHLANPTAGGAIRNLGCYPVSLTRLVMRSEPVHIHAVGNLSAYQTDNNATIELTFTGGATATITTADNEDKSFHFEVIGTKGKLTCLTNPWLATEENNQIRIKRNDVPEETIELNASKGLYTYQIDLVNSTIQRNRISELNNESFLHSYGNVVILSSSLDQILKFSEVKVVS